MFFLKFARKRHASSYVRFCCWRGEARFESASGGGQFPDAQAQILSATAFPLRSFTSRVKVLTNVKDERG